MQIRQLAAWMVLPVVAVLGLAACGDRPDPDRVVRIAIGEPHHLLPSDVNDPDGAQVLSALFAPLVDFDEQGQPYEVAAAAIEPDQESRVWTVRLREEFTFHNGEPVTADRYLDAWNFAANQANARNNNHLFARIEGYQELNPGSSSGSGSATLSGLAKVDDRTFTVTLSEPFVEFRSVLGATAFHPLPEAAFAEPGVLDGDFAAAPIGNGPFRFAGAGAREPGAPIEVTRYEEFAGPAPRIGGVEFVVYDEPADAYADLLAGAVDVVTRLPAEQLSGAAAELGDRYLQRPAATFQFLAVPTHQEELADPDLRRAISMAIDRDHLAGAVRRDAETPARAFAAPVVPGARDDTCGPACRLDPAAARDLYAEADGPAELTITYNVDGGHADWVTTTCDQLRTNLDVACTAAPEPTVTDLLTRIRDREDVGLVRLGWAMDYPSLENYLGPLYSTTGSANFSGYHNPAFDDLLAAGVAATSGAEALAAYQQAEDLLAHDLPVIPLRFGQHHVGHSPQVRDVTVSPLGRIDLTRLEALR